MSGFLCSMVGASFTVAAAAQVLRAKLPIGAFGGATISTTQSKFGGASLDFGDGVGDYYKVTAPSSSYFGGTGDMTFEFQYYRKSSGSGGHITDFRSGGGDPAWTIVDFEDGSTTRLGMYQNGYIVATNIAVPTTTWTHIAIVRQGTSLKWYKNGTLTDTTTTTASAWVNRTDCFIGANFSDQSAGNNINAYIDELRISNSARYTANFTAPTAPFVNDSNTLVLIHANGTNGSTFIEDDNGVRLQRGIEARAGTAVSTTQSKFGGTSMSFGSATGGNGKYAYVNQSYTDFFFGGGATGDRTYECWVYLTAYTPSGTNNTGEGAFPILTLSRGTDGYVQWCFGINESGYLGVDYSATGGFGGTTYYNNSTTLALNTWHHIAMVWQDSGNVIGLYANGTRLVNQASATEPNWEGGIFGLYIGGHYWTPTGFIDEVRISNSARYTANFTPSTTAFVNDANTLLLVHADGTNASTVFTDDNAQLTVTPAATSVNEGSSLTFNVSTVNTADQTLYYTLSNSGDFATSSGSFSLTSNAGSFSVTPTADTTTEGAETFTASVRLGSTSGDIIATTPAVTINDTSVTALARPYVSVGTGAGVETSVKKFGTGSMYGYLTTSLNLPTGNFTIEYFQWVSDRSDRAGVWEITAGSHSILVQSGEIAGGVRNLRFYITNSSGTTLLDYASPSNTLMDNTLTHIAFVRNGNDFYVYMGGTRQTTSTQATFTMPNTSTMLIGRGGGKNMRGVLDEFRISNTARYTGSTLTVPTAAFTNDANTVLLLHMNGAQDSTSFPDDNA